MRFSQKLSVALLVLLLGQPVSPQETHVERRYAKDVGMTVVTSDSLYVINMPEQFMQLTLRGRYLGKGEPLGPPDKIYFEFESYSSEPLYQKDEAHRLAVKADDEILDLGLLGYVALQEGGGNTFVGDPKAAKEGKARLAVRSTLPANALVKTGGKALTLETMSASVVPLSEITKMARANRVLMKIGGTVFQLTPAHMGILREFVASITPAAGAVTSVAPTTGPTEPAVPADVPSGANNATLDQTLKWLKKALPKAGSDSGIGAKGKIEPVDLNNCDIKFRIIPTFRQVPGFSTLVYSILEYQLNLGDLNPETLRITDFKDYAMLSFAARDQEPKIKVVYKANDNGLAGRTMNEKAESSASLNLRNMDTAQQIRAALSHSIKLCQATGRGKSNQ